MNRIGFDRLFEAVVRAMDGLISAHHDHQDYYDKTPGYRMIDATPLLFRHLPEARFIHLHRNGIDNVGSNLRLWPDRHFDDACRMWNSSVRTYLNVRPIIAERLINFDMQDFVDNPWESHLRILAHLDLDHPATEAELRAYFASGSSTSTVELARVQAAPRLSAQKWSDEEKETFLRICGTSMSDLGYPID